ncbi:IS5 family transposase [Streptomyces doebereineriae]|uniref:IS5 family transposase n=1 Tax=Streptomyces doebereineriae TaxID=3075528 RepID=A0ABU2VK21_9ACTN|nr:IS5 family transposase [Streptomyces sp. DSM 41640]MDT0485247.1 IS5 family transposase [Streptomyces sp. DSM 41640]
MTDAEWELIEPLLPPPACTQPSGGRPEKYDRRTVIDAIRYLVDNGIKWRALPTDFGIPWRSLYAYFQRWAAAGLVTHIRDQLHQQVRVRESKNPRTVTVILDAQSVKGAETVGAATRGYDAGKKINGRKRHLAVDTRGLPMFVMVTTAGINDGPLGRDMLLRLRLAHPEVTLAWADSAYLPLVDWANTFLGITLQTVSRPRGQKGFVVLPKRWVVERAISWIMRARRNVRDYERLPQHSEAHISWTLITLMTRRLTKSLRKQSTAPPAAAPEMPRPVRIRASSDAIRLAPAPLR